MILVTSVCFNLFSDGLRSAMDCQAVSAALPEPGAQDVGTTDVGGPAQPLLSVRGLVKHFPVRGGMLNRTLATVQAVDGVDFAVAKGETLGIVGGVGLRQVHDRAAADPPDRARPGRAAVRRPRHRR